MPTHLTAPEMKQFVQDHFEDFVNRRNASVIHKNMSPDFYDHDGPGGKPTNINGDEGMMIKMYEAMEDLKVTIEDIVAEDDIVICRNIWHWTDPASKQQLQFQGFVQWRFDGEKISERWATVTPPSGASSWSRAEQEGRK